MLFLISFCLRCSLYIIQTSFCWSPVHRDRPICINFFAFISIFLFVLGHSGKNPIFDYYELIDEGKVVCKICGCVMAYKKSSYLTNVARHLKRHGKYFEEYNHKKLELKTSRMRSYYSSLLIASSHSFKLDVQ